MSEPSYMRRLVKRSAIFGLLSIVASVAITAATSPPAIIAFATGVLLGFVAVTFAIATTK